MKIGYKGTESDMKCRDVQFELGKTYYIDDKNEVKELLDGYTLIKQNIELCSKQAIHYCDTLEGVFKHYVNNGSNRFFKIEVLGEFEDGGDKSGARCIKFLEEVSKETLENLIKEQEKLAKEKEEERLDEKMHLPELKILQELNPNLIVGGSISLYLQGVRLKRFKNGDVDYDFSIPYYQPMVLGEDMDTEEGEDERSGSDYEENFFINGVKADLRIDPRQKYELVDYKGFTYKVIPLLTILKAKVEYSFTKWGEKHKEDIKEMILNK